MKSYRGAGTYFTDDHHDGVLTEHEKIDDGRWHHRFGASWLKTTDICLERARKEHTHEMPEEESDAACVGTALHTVIETNLQCELSLADSVDLWHHEFSTLMQLPSFTWKKYTEEQARRFGEGCVTTFYTQVLDTIPRECKLETRFVLPFVEDEHRIIELSGAIDYAWAEGLKDWKSNGSRKYEKWEKQRWDTQATVYTWAAVMLGLVDYGTVPFEFVVMNAKEAQRVPVTRNWRDWEFLKDKVTHVAELIEQEVQHWPLNDNHALCSELWCPAWDTCKGKNGLKMKGN